MFTSHLPRLFSLLVISLALLLAGCVTVQPKDAAKFDADAANARAFDARVQALTSPVSDQDLASLKRWSAADARDWTDTANWANGRPAATQP